MLFKMVKIILNWSHYPLVNAKFMWRGCLIWLALGEEYRYCCLTSLNCSMADVLCIRGSLQLFKVTKNFGFMPLYEPIFAYVMKYMYLPLLILDS